MNRQTITHLTRFLIVFLILCANSPESLSLEKNQMVVDSLGRQVTLPDQVDRIACMYAFTGHVVAMLGKADGIVAVSNGLKRDVLLSTIYPAFGNAVVPKVQGEINIEELLGAKPDIVFIQSRTGRNPAMAGKLDAVGLTWIAVDFHNMKQQQDVIAMIGRAVNASEKADQYNAYYNSCIDRVEMGVANIPQENRLRVFHATVDPTRTSSKNTLPADWINAAGVINVAAQANLLNGNQHVGIEQILLWNPDAVLTNEPGVADAIRNSSEWSAVSAVKNDLVYQMPIGISRWGHPGSLETPLAILWTAKTVYPERFGHVDMKTEVKNFYKTFFHYSVSDKMIDRILSGQGMRLSKNRKTRL